MTAFSGVRSSWLIRDRKSLFDRFAASAISLASRCACSRRRRSSTSNAYTTIARGWSGSELSATSEMSTQRYSPSLRRNRTSMLSCDALVSVTLCIFVRSRSRSSSWTCRAHEDRVDGLRRVVAEQSLDVRADERESFGRAGRACDHHRSRVQQPLEERAGPTKFGGAPRRRALRYRRGVGSVSPRRWRPVSP